LLDILLSASIADIRNAHGSACAEFAYILFLFKKKNAVAQQTLAELQKLIGKKVLY
jgi:hypothetical protein